MTFTKHPVWEVFPDAKTFDSFQQHFVPQIFLKNEVPEIIRKAAIASEKLLVHSYYEYDFVDIALTHSIFNFEKALRLRWAEINGKETKKNLEYLIDWFYNKKYFETFNDNLAHQLRQIRNRKVHAATESVGGVMFIRKVYETYYLINDLYEDPKLRIARANERHSLANSLAALTEKGTILTYNDLGIIIFCVHPLFIDNKSKPQTLCLFVCPIFDPTHYDKNEVYTPPHFTVKIKDWKFDGNIFSGIDIKTGSLIFLTLIQDEVNLNKFHFSSGSFWNNENALLNRYSVTAPADDLFIKELRLFHQS